MMCLKPVRLFNPTLDLSRYDKTFDRDKLEARYGDKLYINVPCGKCEACIERKSNEWATRIYHEWLVSDTSYFCTLTYAEEFLPINVVTLLAGDREEEHELPSLCKRDVQLFMKRLRKKLGNGLRFFLGGEYGETDGRPHYHFVIFNFPAYLKEDMDMIVQDCWSYGGIQTNDLNIRRVMYVAKYIYSSATWKKDMIKGLQLPFILSSRRPGLGSCYCNDMSNIRYHNTTLETVVTIDDGRVMPMPRFYRDKIFSKENKEILLQRFIDEPLEPPTEDEVNVFLKRFREKKKKKKL